jgi:hypothetical protein
MNRKNILIGILLTCITVISLYLYDPKDAQADSIEAAKTLILYDAVSGNIPASPLMGFADFPPGVSPPTYVDTATVLDTTLSGSDTYAGWVSSQATVPGFPGLNPVMGFQVNFTMQMESETHTNNDRAGFSVLILDQDVRGIELSFWTNEIWVQNDDSIGGLFKHGEAVAFSTTSSSIDYQVTIAGNTYTLMANAAPILSGTLRDYKNFEGFPDPYETPNFLFLGDDTTSAQARVRLQFVSVTGREPAIPTSTTMPLPIASPTTLSITTPVTVPSPTPISKGIDFCPSGWLLAVVVTVSVMMVKQVRQRK